MTGPFVSRRPLLLVLALAVLGAACTEELSTSSACGGLCPDQGLEVQQVELQPVELDTTVAGFPLRGTEPLLLVARAGDTLDARAVYRFDSLPRTYLAAGVEEEITEVHAAVLELLVARAGQSYVPVPLTVEAFDVDVAGDDTSTTALAAAFTPERRLGAGTLQPRAATDTTSVDTLRIPVDAAALLRKVTTDSALRVGLRLAGPDDGRVLVSPVAAQLVFRPTAAADADTLFATPFSKTPEGQNQLRIDLSSFTIVVAGTAPTPPSALVVGGLPGRRALLRFALPRAIVDSSTVLRATLVLTQAPTRGYLERDTLWLQPLAVTASEPVQDVRRRMLLASNALNPFTGRRVLTATPLPLVPGDSGEVEISIPELVGSWRTFNDVGFLPELVLASVNEGASPVQVRFFSTEAEAGLRPRLRVSYVQRIDFLLP